MNDLVSACRIHVMVAWVRCVGTDLGVDSGKSV